VTHTSDSIVIVDGKRTPFGRFGGSLKEISAVELGARAIRGILDGLPIQGDEIDAVVMGQCLPGEGLSPARQVVLAAGLTVGTNALTADRACCSALTAIGLGAQMIQTGHASVVAAGGMENMSRTPYLLSQARWGARLGDFVVRDELVIRNPYLNQPMAQYAGEVAVENGVGREDQDEWALRSHMRWAAARSEGRLEDELIAVVTNGPEQKLEWDEHPRPNTNLEKLTKLKPVYKSPTVTAGNASGICDGAAATLLMTEQDAKERGLVPLGKIIAYRPICGEPRQSPLLPAVALQQALAQTGLTLDDMELIEINEAFASMPLVSSLVLGDSDRQRTEKIRDRLNVNGGAIAIGHPIGATGARLAMTVLYEMRRRGGGYCAVSICGAIGQADAMILQV
jgi:acetyl-CoA C-acetyltransferase